MSIQQKGLVNIQIESATFNNETKMILLVLIKKQDGVITKDVVSMSPVDCRSAVDKLNLALK
jgi:hypothetical protein